MFRHILVPVDFTPKATRAARAAARIAAPGAEVTLLHVIERIHDLPGMGRFYRKLERMARGKAQTIAAFFVRRKIRVRVVIVYGDPLQETLRFASGDGVADLIVMGSHRFSPRRAGHGWGTLSYKVGLLSACPVLLVK